MIGDGIAWLFMKGKLLTIEDRGLRVGTVSRDFSVDVTQQVRIVAEEAKMGSQTTGD